MEQERIENLLEEFARRTEELPRPQLAAGIKERIPGDLGVHRKGLDTIRIIVDLKIGRLAAAAVILAALIFSAAFFDSIGPGESIYKDGKILAQYIFTFGKAGSREPLDALFRVGQNLSQEGKEVVYYGDAADAGDPNAILIHWRLSGDAFRVIYGNFRTEVVTADELIKKQAQMLQHRKK
jgi:hypothetical protein